MLIFKFTLLPVLGQPVFFRDVELKSADNKWYS